MASSSSDDDTHPKTADDDIQPSSTPLSPLSHWVTTQLLIFPLNPDYPEAVTFVPTCKRRAVKRKLVDDFRQPPAMLKKPKVAAANFPGESSALPMPTTASTDHPIAAAGVRPPLAPLRVFPVASGSAGRTQDTAAAAAAATSRSSRRKCSRRFLHARLGQLEVQTLRAWQQKSHLLKVNRKLRRLAMKRRPTQRHFGCQTEDQLYYEMY